MPHQPVGRLTIGRSLPNCPTTHPQSYSGATRLLAVQSVPDRVRVVASDGDITKLLAAMRRGDPEAEANLVALVYDDFHALARRYMSRERPNHTLQPTPWSTKPTSGCFTTVPPNGRAARTSSPPLPSSCGASWWTTRAPAPPPNVPVGSSAWNSTSSWLRPAR